MKSSDSRQIRINALRRVLIDGSAKALKEEAVAMLCHLEQEASDPDQDHTKRIPLLHIDKTGVLKAGDRIGPFRVEKLIGEGGMGKVYLAVRNDDLDLKAAVKTLTHWPPRLQNLFQSECKILSGLRHRGIAHLIDAGSTADGQPWMAMEYVRGVPLHEYLKQNNPGLEERLILFLKICDAVSHAHRQLIVHSDLKPTNIMVTADGMPKLLDFGIASILDPETGHQLTITMSNERILTPAYASPEQVNGRRLTAASDVYSLGVLLYEILTDCKPYKINVNQPLEIIHVVNHEPISRPSSAGDEDTGSPGRFSSSLRGDLDTIVMKALERDLERRYPSVEALSGDLRLFMDGQPITARPATAGYRLRKFASRNPWPLAASAGLVLFLSLFALYAHNQGKVIAAERDHARSQQLMAENVTHFLVRLFEKVDPDEAGGEITAYEVLESGRMQLENTLEDQTQVKIRLMAAMGRVYRALGKYDTAIQLQNDLIAMEDQNDALVDEHLLDLIHTLQDTGDLVEAERWLERLEGRVSDTNPLLQRRTLHVRGVQWLLWGRYQDADQTFKRALVGTAAVTDDIIDLLDSQALLYSKWGFYNRALEALKPVLEAKRAEYGETHSTVAATLLHMADLYSQNAQITEATQLHNEVARIYDNLYEPGHPAHARLWTSIGKRLHLAGMYDQAEVYLRDALNLRRKRLGEAHRSYEESLQDLASLLSDKREMDQAEELYRIALNSIRLRVGPDHPDYARALNRLGSLLHTRENLDDAESAYRQSLDIGRKFWGEHHAEYGLGLNNLARIFKDRGNLDRAEYYYRKAMNILKQSLGERHTNYTTLLNNIAGLLYLKGDLPEAVEMFQHCIRVRREVLGNQHPAVSIALYNLAIIHKNTGRLEEALVAAREALAIREQILDKTHPDYGMSCYLLADILEIQGNWELAPHYLDQAMPVFKAHFTNNNHRLHAARSIQGAILMQQGDLDQAEELLRTARAELVRISGEDHADVTQTDRRLKQLSSLRLAADKQ